MPTQLQIRRGSTSDHNSFTGAAGELTVDTTKDTLRVHDGSTAGGFELARADGSNLNNITNNITVNGTVTADGLTVDTSSGITINGTGTGATHQINRGTGATNNTRPVVTLNADSTGDAADGFGASIKFELSDTGVDNSELGAIGFKRDGGDGLGMFAIGQDSQLLHTNRQFTVASNGDVSLYEDTGTTAKLTWDASAENLNFADSSKATFGAGSDLQIYHDGSHSVIQDAGTGDLRLYGNNVKIKNADNTAAYIQAINGAEVNLYYDGYEKLTTTSSGVNVTGTVTADGLTVDGATDGTAVALLRADNNSLTKKNTLRFEDTDTTTQNDQQIGRIEFYSNDTDHTGVDAVIEAVSATTALKELRFLTSETVNTPLSRLAIGKNGDISFYNSAGTSQSLFWDASAESLGLGTSSPQAKLDVSSVGNFSTGYNTFTGDGLHIQCAGTSGNGNYAGGISFSRISSDNNTRAAGIAAVQTETDPDRVGLAFLTHDSNTTANDLTEAMRLDSSGNLFVGKTSDDATTTGVVINDNGYTKIVRTSATANVNTVLQLNRLSTDGEILRLQKDGSTVGSIGTVFGDLTIGTVDTGIRFVDDDNSIRPWNITTNALTDATIDLGISNGRFKDLYLSGGVVFGATGGNVSSKTLDDYEDGTFTPEIGDVTGNTGTTSTARGHYTKVGRLVTIVVDIQNIDTTSLVSTEQVRIKSLPFNSFTAADAPTFTAIAQVSGIGASGKTIIASLQDQFSYVRLKESDSGLSSYLPVSAITSPTADIRFSLTYFTN